MLCLIFSQALSSTFAVFHLTLVFKGFTALVPQGPDEPNPLFSRVFEADARKTAKVELRLHVPNGVGHILGLQMLAENRAWFKPKAPRVTLRTVNTRPRVPYKLLKENDLRA